MTTEWTPEPERTDTPPLPYTGPYARPSGAPNGPWASAPDGAGLPPAVGAPPPYAASVNFDRFGCADLATDAVRFSRDVEYPGDPLLASVEDLVLLEDGRGDLQVPVAGEYSLVMSCTGTGRWEDDYVAPVVLELLIGADGLGVINYGLQ